MPGQCCVFQIFDDGGAYDKRYDEVISPAIKAADLDPYRVDRDVGAEIPIDTLHEEIRRSVVCLADITLDNPNIWYELGFAVASDQPIVMICKKGRTLPFDTHHRSTIFYTQESPRDFDQLKKEITDRLKAALERRVEVQRSSIKATGGLTGAGDLPTKEQVQEWLSFVKEYDFDWGESGGGLNIIYEPVWVEMRPFLSEDTVRAANQIPGKGDLVDLIRFYQNPKRFIHTDHLKRLMHRDFTALLLKSSAADVL